MAASHNAFVAAFKDFLTGRGLTKTIGLELINLREHIFLNKYGINHTFSFLSHTGAVRADRDHFLRCVRDGTPAAGAEIIAMAKRKELEDFASNQMQSSTMKLELIPIVCSRQNSVQTTGHRK
jgi:hypothetical protein